MCSQHGYCKGGKCHCLEDWTGEDCNTMQCYKNCNNHGKCNDKYECECYQGFKGK